ncbi:MAG: hypothetical protein FJ319_07755 [SAR202 cluster bacterium]|nr:hypothetical protein [SAR202 cluster bacterium]
MGARWEQPEVVQLEGDNPIMNATYRELGAAVDENLFALFRAMATQPGSEIVETPRLAYHLCPPTNPMYKGVWRSRLSDEEADSAIDEAISWFRERNAPFMFWWTGPGTTPDDLGQRLEARSFLSMEAQMEQMAAGIKSTELGAPGMAADLNRMNEAALRSVPCKIKRDWLMYKM